MRTKKRALGRRKRRLRKLEFVGEYMKNLYIVGGTMGVGKTAVCQQLKMNLSNSVLLESHPKWSRAFSFNTVDFQAAHPPFRFYYIIKCCVFQ